MSSNAGRRSRVEDTEGRILAAARELFIAQGYQDTTLSAVADRARSGPGPSTCGSVRRGRCCCGPPAVELGKPPATHGPPDPVEPSPGAAGRDMNDSADWSACWPKPPPPSRSWRTPSRRREPTNRTRGRRTGRRARVAGSMGPRHRPGAGRGDRCRAGCRGGLAGVVGVGRLGCGSLRDVAGRHDHGRCFAAEVRRLGLVTMRRAGSPRGELLVGVGSQLSDLARQLAERPDVLLELLDALAPLAAEVVDAVRDRVTGRRRGRSHRRRPCRRSRDPGRCRSSWVPTEIKVSYGYLA